jgi:sphingolipid delta-4 desaturase
MQAFFHQSEFDQPHPGRARAIIKAHPEVRQLMGRNPYTALIALSLVTLQTGIAFWMGKLGLGYWWLSLFIAWWFTGILPVRACARERSGFRTLSDSRTR